MSHKNNKNSKDNKKAGPKTKKELDKMRMETANEIGVSKESKKLGHETKQFLPYKQEKEGDVLIKTSPFHFVYIRTLIFPQP